MICNICYENKDKNCNTCNACKFLSCNECMKQYIKSQCNIGFKTKFLTCPNLDCNRYISKSKIIKMTSKNFYNRTYIKYIEYKNKKIDYNINKYCPKCSKINIINNNDFITCSECSFLFCSRCDYPNHNDDVTCDEHLKKIKKHDKSSYLSYTYQKENYKRCPLCRIFIHRTYGCDYMECTNCKHTFCWNCLETLSPFNETHFCSKNTTFNYDNNPDNNSTRTEKLFTMIFIMLFWALIIGLHIIFNKTHSKVAKITTMIGLIALFSACIIPRIIPDIININNNYYFRLYNKILGMFVISGIISLAMYLMCLVIDIFVTFLIRELLQISTVLLSYFILYHIIYNYNIIDIFTT